jgi:rhodanese-related sulfurtransferase
MHKRNWMKWTAALVLGAGLALPVLAVETPKSLAGVKAVTAEEAKKLIDAGAPAIDTRVAAEYAEKTIKGAISVTYREKSAKEPGFDASLDQFDLAKLPANKAAPVVLFCNAGECWRSYKAASVAAKAGYTNVNWLRGGMPEWTSKGLPTQ